jgi:hypothetical protein
VEAARRLYRPATGTTDLDDVGLPSELAGSFVEKACEILPCNWKTVQLFVSLQTQWRVGMNGPTGLDYAAIPIVARGEKIRLTASRILGIRVMEGAALAAMAERRE